MIRRCFQVLSAALLLAPSASSARLAHIPLEPGTLGGPGIFTYTQSQVAQAATNAGLEFTADPRPLLPQVILPLDTAAATVQQRDGLLFWRGDMLPDQLAPAETGTLVRKSREPDGSWKTLRTKDNYALAPLINLMPVIRTTSHFALPRMIIETPYQLGTLGGTPVNLVLWRTTEEDSLPLGGAIAVSDPPPALLEALNAILPPFESQADWAAEFDALAP